MSATWWTSAIRFVREMAKEMSYWAAWPVLTVESLPPLEPHDSPELHRLLDVCPAPCPSVPGHMPSTPSAISSVHPAGPQNARRPEPL